MSTQEPKVFHISFANVVQISATMDGGPHARAKVIRVPFPEKLLTPKGKRRLSGFHTVLVDIVFRDVPHHTIKNKDGTYTVTVDPSQPEGGAPTP